MNKRRAGGLPQRIYTRINFLHYSTLWEAETSNVVNVGRESGGLVRGVVGNTELEWV